MVPRGLWLLLVCAVERGKPHPCALSRFASHETREGSGLVARSASARTRNECASLRHCVVGVVRECAFDRSVRSAVRTDPSAPRHARRCFPFVGGVAPAGRGCRRGERRPNHAAAPASASAISIRCRRRTSHIGFGWRRRWAARIDAVPWRGEARLFWLPLRRGCGNNLLKEWFSAPKVAAAPCGGRSTAIAV